MKLNVLQERRKFLKVQKRFSKLRGGSSILLGRTKDKSCNTNALQDFLFFEKCV